MSLVYIDYTNSQGDVETLSLHATTEVTVTAKTITPSQIVEAGYDVTTNAVNKGYVISFKGIVASGNDGLSPVDYLNKLYALRDSKEFFRVVSGDTNVVSNFHPSCLFNSISRTQNDRRVTMGEYSAYEVSIEILAVRVASLADIREVRPEEIDLLTPTSTTASTTKQVDESKDEELYRKAQAISERNIYQNSRARGTSPTLRETDVDVIYEDLLLDRAAKESVSVNTARSYIADRRGNR